MQAVIFDMDGILIDSEPYWKQAEKRVFSSLGLTITDADTQKTVGMTTRQATLYWLELAKKPHEPTLIASLEKDVLDEVASLITTQGRAMSGVYALLTMLKQAKIKIGLATNAPTCTALVVLETLKIIEFFNIYVTADDVKHGKPHPEIYHLALEKLGVQAEETLVFEDSVTGMTAAQTAGIKTIVVPSLENYKRTEFDTAALKLTSLDGLNLKQLVGLLQSTEN